MHEALEHEWLRASESESSQRIPSSRYSDMRDKIKMRYVRLQISDHKCPIISDKKCPIISESMCLYILDLIFQN